MKLLALITFLLIFVALNFADVAVNIQKGEKTIGGTFSDNKWYDFDEKLLTFNVDSNHGINDVLFTISTDTDENVKGLDMQNNKFIEFLPENVDEKFPNLIAYTAWNCSVKSIFAQNFRYMRKLELLGLQRNQIEYIDDDIFNDLVALRFLRLSYNKILYVAQNAFKNLRKLEALYFGYNKLGSLRFNLEPLVALKNLTMSDNQLSILPKNHFEYNKKLECVWFDNNKIRFINPTLFDGLNNLDYVDFENNTCINSYYDTSDFAAMKEIIKNDC